MAKKATLVCRPCGTAVSVSGLGAAVIECYECGMELQPAARAPKKAAAKKAAPKKKAAAKKAPARKAAPKKKAK
jgi:ribosomal protein L37AE/L43A